MPFNPISAPLVRVQIRPARLAAERFALGALAALCAIWLVVVAGCDSSTATPPATPPPPTAPAQGGTAPATGPAATDTAAAQTPALPAAHRVIAYAPSLVEFICAMGEQNRLIGVSEQCTYPPLAAQLPVMGGAVQPDLEKIVSAKPDLILGIGKSEKLLALASDTPGDVVRVEALQIETLDQIKAAPMQIATLMGVPERGKGLQARIAADLGTIAKRCEPRTSTPRVLVFTGEGGGARFTVGKGSFLTDLVALCGGDCVTKDFAERWPNMGLEDLAKSNPDVILMLMARDDVTAAEKQASIDQWKEYPEFPAVKNHRIFVLTGSHLLIAGPRINVTALQFAQSIHPELFPQPHRAPTGATGAPGMTGATGAKLPAGHPGVMPNGAHAAMPAPEGDAVSAPVPAPVPAPVSAPAPAPAPAASEPQP